MTAARPTSAGQTEQEASDLAWAATAMFSAASTITTISSPIPSARGENTSPSSTLSGSSDTQWQTARIIRSRPESFRPTKRAMVLSSGSTALSSLIRTTPPSGASTRDRATSTLPEYQRSILQEEKSTITAITTTQIRIKYSAQRETIISTP